MEEKWKRSGGSFSDIRFRVFQKEKILRHRVLYWRHYHPTLLHLAHPIAVRGLCISRTGRRAKTRLTISKGVVRGGEGGGGKRRGLVLSASRRPPRIIDIILAAPILLFPALTQPLPVRRPFPHRGWYLMRMSTMSRLIGSVPESLTPPTFEFLDRRRLPTELNIFPRKVYPSKKTLQRKKNTPSA